jgi:hypothetical protein
MWFKRSYGQLAKCTEAQALRKAFPEFGAQPTADEMEGKTLNEISGETIDGATGEIANKKPAIPPLSDEEFAKQKPKWHTAVQNGKKTPAELIAWVLAQNLAVLTEAQLKEINGWKKVEPEAKEAPNAVGSEAIDAEDIPF